MLKADHDWRDDALCAQPGADPKRWDSDSIAESVDQAAEAANRCAGCPVLRECAEDALHPAYSVDGAPLYTVGVIRAGVIT
ncbi:WhiB family transcriptional regulator [Nocardia transvalensis]|uniref:WhiB family transcriptional regulator n=1 Tax=Nocardia transvalensis TaxID=37333 RepID=UPI0018947BD4|nr:WhiB family transcriptional regulator [Nocardia transvalensis]